MPALYLNILQATDYGTTCDYAPAVVSHSMGPQCYLKGHGTVTHAFTDCRTLKSFETPGILLNPFVEVWGGSKSSNEEEDRLVQFREYPLIIEHSGWKGEQEGDIRGK